MCKWVPVNCYWTLLVCEVEIGHVRYINILMAPRLSGQKYNFLRFSCPSIPKRHLDTKKTMPNIDLCPENLGSMLENWYIERGLLVLVLLISDWMRKDREVFKPITKLSTDGDFFRYSSDPYSVCHENGTKKRFWISDGNDFRASLFTRFIWKRSLFVFKSNNRHAVIEYSGNVFEYLQG